MNTKYYFINNKKIILSISQIYDKFMINYDTTKVLQTIEDHQLQSLIEEKHYEQIHFLPFSYNPPLLLPPTNT